MDSTTRPASVSESPDPDNESDKESDSCGESNLAGSSHVAPDEGDKRLDQGPGWLPAIMAGTLLMGILGFIFCAFSTWVLFQKRTELAIRTLKGAYVTELEQSLLEPETKRRVVEEIRSLVAEMEGGKYEDWQSAAIMQRLQRLPVLQWGQLQAVQSSVKKAQTEDKTTQLRELSRLERAVEIGKVTSFDFQDVLDPVLRADPGSSSGYELVRPLQPEAVADVVLRAKLIADRAEVPDEDFPDVDLAKIVAKEIEEGAAVGGY